jgi:hypothetical protein
MRVNCPLCTRSITVVGERTIRRRHNIPNSDVFCESMGLRIEAEGNLANDEERDQEITQSQDSQDSENTSVQGINNHNTPQELGNVGDPELRENALIRLPNVFYNR